MTAAQLNALMSKVTRVFSTCKPQDGPLSSQCLVWMRYKDRRGYGRVKMNGKNYKAHRIMWQQVNGPIPEGMFVCHLCDHPSCVNPEHLFLGTPLDNTRDMEAKGRASHPRGERNGASKLTEKEVQEIRMEYAKGGSSQRTLAARFGVAKTLVGNIVRRESWRHIK